MSIQRIPKSYLPPDEHRPDLVFALPQQQYPQKLNAAVELLDLPIQRGWGDRVAYFSGDQQVTYRDLSHDVSRLGNALIGLGVRPGDRVLLRLPDRPELVICLLALMKIGAVGVPTFTLFRAADLLYREADSEAVAVIADARLLDEVERARREFKTAQHFIAVGETTVPGYLSYEALLAGASERLEAAGTRRDDLTLLLYTSGSTGDPKGCCQSHSDVLAIVDGFCSYEMPLRAGDVIVGQPPLPFSMGIGFFLSFPLRCGVAAVLVEEKKPDVLLRAIERYRGTVFVAVPTFYNMMIEIATRGKYDTSTLRELRTGGEPLIPAIEERIETHFGLPLYEVLGSTESLHCIVSRRSGAPIRRGSFGRPIAGFQVVVRDAETFAELPRGEAGLLTFRGPTGVKYWRKPEEQAKSVRDGWSILQDVIRMDVDGYCSYVARNDDLIVSAGYNIAPTEVETVLNRHPAVLESACVPAPDPGGQRAQVVKACVVVREGFEASDELARDIQTFFKEHAAPHLYPRVVEFHSSLPKTLTGKIRRSELRVTSHASRVSGHESRVTSAEC